MDKVELTNQPHRTVLSLSLQINIINWKRFGKPVIIGEYGNAVVNWDATSDPPNRLSTWSAFFAEGALVFWNTSLSKSYSNPNSVANA